MSSEKNLIEQLFNPKFNPFDLVFEKLPNHVFVRLVNETASYLQVSRSMVATHLLGMLACAAQGAYEVEFPANKSSPLSLYTLTLADPSEGKSALEEFLNEPVHAFEKKLLKRFVQDMNVYKKKHSLWLLRYKELEKKLKKAYREVETQEPLERLEEEFLALQDEEPQQPKEPRFLYDDITSEALLDQLEQNLPIATLTTSEATSVLNGRATASFSFLNALWSGSPAKQNRITRPGVDLNDARLTLALLTQPSAMDAFLKKRGEMARGTGFLSRFLLCIPPRMSGYREYTQPRAKPQDSTYYANRIDQLLQASIDNIQQSEQDALKPEPEEGQISEPKEALPSEEPTQARFKKLTFSANARIQLNAMIDACEKRLRPDEIYYFASDHGGKLANNIARVAGLIHLFSSEGLEIQDRSLYLAIHLVMDLSRHYMNAFVGKPALIQDAERFVRHVFYNYTAFTCGKETFTGICRTKMMQHGHFKADTLAAVENLLGMLGYLSRSRGHYTLHLLPQKESALKNGYSFLIELLPHYSLVIDNPFKNEEGDQLLLSRDPQQAEAEREWLNNYAMTLKKLQALSHIARRNSAQREEYDSAFNDSERFKQQIIKAHQNNLRLWMKEQGVNLVEDQPPRTV